MLVYENKNIKIYKPQNYERFLELTDGNSHQVLEGNFKEEVELIYLILGDTVFNKIIVRLLLNVFADKEDFLIDQPKFFKRNPDVCEFFKKEKLKLIPYVTKELKWLVENNFLDYNKIKNENVIIVQNPDEIYDINFIITVRNRKEFAQPIYDSFLKAREKSNLNICYTVSEHSEIPVHAKFCKKNKLNYIWVKSEPNELFNKCLAYNMAFLFTNKAKYYLFHDLDLLIQSDFFNKVFDNISKTKCRAMQCFKERRALYCNEELTAKIINKSVNIDDLKLNKKDVDLPRLGGKVMLGAPGGSILVERDLFIDVGGYDGEMFLAYSPEDTFFWEKLSVYTKVQSAENPEIDVFHMYHPPSWPNNPRLGEMEKIYADFEALSDEGKKEFIEYKSNMFKKFIT